MLSRMDTRFHIMAKNWQRETMHLFYLHVLRSEKHVHARLETLTTNQCITIGPLHVTE